MPAILAEDGISSRENKITLHLMGALDPARSYLNGFYLDWQALEIQHYEIVTIVFILNNCFNNRKNILDKHCAERRNTPI